MKLIFRILFKCLVLIFLTLSVNHSFSQEEIQVETTEQIQNEFEVPEEKQKSFFSSFKAIFKKKEKQEQQVPPPKLEVKEEKTSPVKDLRDKHSKELDELRVKQKKEKEELQQRLEEEKKQQEQEEEKKTLLQNEIRKKEHEESFKNSRIARKQIRERRKEIWKAKFLKRFVEVISKESDPIFIISAEVKNGKTAFLGVKNVEFKYRLKLVNQTPKIINSVLIIWEREVPFRGLLIAKETRVSKPIIPYGKRVVDYNDLDSKREGESYKVKVARVIFEDGTEWINPAYKKA